VPPSIYLPDAAVPPPKERAAVVGLVVSNVHVVGVDSAPMETKLAGRVPTLTVWAVLSMLMVESLSKAVPAVLAI